MTIQASPFIVPMIPACSPAVMGGPVTAAGSVVSIIFNGASDKIAMVFQAYSTTPPDSIDWHIGTVTTAGTTGDIEATLETLAADGTPSGTPVTNSATGTATISTTGYKSISGMAGTASLTVGTQYALVLTAGTGWDRSITMAYSIGINAALSMPYALTKDSAGAWSAKLVGTNWGFLWGCRDSGGTRMYIPGLAGPMSTASTFQSFSNATNPDERGNRFSLPFPATLVGVWLAYTGGSTPGANDNFSVSAYSDIAGAVTQLATQPIDGDAQGGSAPHLVLFPSAVSLSANTVYGIAFKATGSDSAQVFRWDYNANDDLACFMGINFYSITRDGGSGAPTGGGNTFTSDSAKVYAVFPVFAGFDDGAGGGGGLAANPIRGFV